MYTSSNSGNEFTVPEQYIINGTIGDLGVLCGNEANASTNYVAKSTSCAHLKSNNRPIWGMMMFNNAYLKYDQVGFQQILYVGVLYCLKVDSLNDAYSRLFGLHVRALSQRQSLDTVDQRRLLLDLRYSQTLSPSALRLRVRKRSPARGPGWHLDRLTLVKKNRR
jgi:hypothetical protein